MIVLCCLAFSGEVFAEDHDYIGQSQWRLMAEGEKAFYLQGLIDGAFLQDESFNTYKNLNWNRVTIGNIVQGLNEFFADFRHQNIPVPVATLLIQLKAMGEDSQVIEKLKRDFSSR